MSETMCLGGEKTNALEAGKNKNLLWDKDLRTLRDLLTQIFYVENNKKKIYMGFLGGGG